MKRTGRLRKQIITYTLAAAVALSAGAAGSGFVSQAAYIQYDNIVVRDAPETGNVIEGLNAGVEVTVLDSANGSDGRTWNQVEYTVNGATHRGWVRADLMSESNPSGDNGGENDGNASEPTKEQDNGDSQTDSDTQKQDKNTGDTKESKDAGSSSDEKNQNGADTSADVSKISGDGYLADGDDTFLVRGESLKISGDFSNSEIPVSYTHLTLPTILLG